MKAIKFATVLLFWTPLAFAQSIVVDADKKLNQNFSQYKTFYWSSQVDHKLDPGFYFLNDIVLKDRIRKAVSYAMEGRGYRKTSHSPDLIVNFRVFETPTTIKGYSGYGTTYFGSEEVRTPEDTTSFRVDKGTTIVYLVDRKSGQIVWRGFASGLMNGYAFDRREDRIKQAINLIFKEYDYRADMAKGE